MKKYEQPMVDLLLIDEADILTASNGENDMEDNFPPEDE